MQTDNDMLLRLKKELDHLEKSHKVGLVSKEEFEKNKERIERKMFVIDERKKDQEKKKNAVHEILNAPSQSKNRTEEIQPFHLSQKKVETINTKKEKSNLLSQKKSEPTEEKAESTHKISKIETTKTKKEKTKSNQKESIVVSDFQKKEQENKERKTRQKIGKSIAETKKSITKTESIEHKKERRDPVNRWNLLLTVLILMLIVLIYFKVQAQGSSDQITITEYADYECGYCAQAQETLHELEKIYGTKLIFQFRYFPLNEGEGMNAAMAAECANKQGKFWEYHKTLFANNEQLAVRDLQQYALDVNLNFSKFNECLNTQETKKEVLREKAEGEKRGVQWTPTFFVNDQMIVGAVDRETFQKVIESELEKQSK